MRENDNKLETSAIFEAGHMIQELRAIQTVLSQQIMVLEDLKKARPLESTSEPRLLAALDKVINDMQTYRLDIDHLEQWATGSKKEVCKRQFSVLFSLQES